MTPVETLRKAADEFRAIASVTNHQGTPCGGLMADCQKCRRLRLADDCDRAAYELERDS